MKRLTIFVALIALIYSGYWFAGSSALKIGIQTQMTKMADDGWTISYDALQTRGYPSRFDTTVTDLNITTPDQASNFSAAMMQVLALSYQPNKAIIAFPPEQTLNLDGFPLRIKSDGLRASISANANTALSLQQASAEAESAGLFLGDGQLTALQDALVVIRENSGAPNTYDAYLTLNDLAWPDLILGQLPPNTGLPATISNATLDTAVTLDRPLDRHTLPAWSHDPGKLRSVNLRGFAVTWGAFEVNAKGDFIVDQTGTPDGTITLTVNDWEGLLDAAVATGRLPAQFQFLARSMGQTLSDGDETLVLPITAQNGNLSIGPFPMGPAPKFP